MAEGSVGGLWFAGGETAELAVGVRPSMWPKVLHVFLAGLRLDLRVLGRMLCLWSAERGDADFHEDVFKDELVANLKIGKEPSGNWYCAWSYIHGRSRERRRRT